ncbi:hypothetical protein B1A87_007080 [Arthrobacter sp. KBS0703]|uniref:hypothetical protein n=1 Tax=Arthrobacter sp. KBS0703 TaxID=1955698 RepID=UPI00098FB6FC|nr:hypothetical protein [Arthrobacter sp. KBS0703]TSE15699.1 hypothetical protein B1A87_007080 [Arthrobacter sp. KBS0703]
MKRTIRTRTGFAAIAFALGLAAVTALPAQAAGTPHTNWNFSIDSTANVVAYDAGGTLWSYTSVSQGLQTAARRAIGPAGAALPKAFFVTDWNADVVPDLIVQNKNGTLTFRQGISTGGFTDSTIGSGWQNYEITVGEWKRTDKYPSIIARNNATGELFNYGNPSGKNLSPRVKIGAFWNGLSFNLLDWDKDGNNDVVAKNAAGQMKLYRASGGGSFISETRATIGSGWNSMTSIRTISVPGPHGSVGLMARDIAGVLHYYQTGKSSWAPRQTFTSGWSSFTLAGN